MILNAVEKGQDLNVSGTSANLAEGTVVTVSLNGKNYTATTAADGTWNLTVPAADLAGLGQANYTLNATATNGVGNSVSNTANLLVDTALPTVTINTVAGDNVINAAEVAAGQTISGSVANAEAGNTVTVTIGGNSYTATVQSDLSWSVSVPESVLTALGNGDLTVSATVTNGHGNTGTGERDITIDANLPGLRVDTVAGDDVINSIEHGQNLIVTGSSDGLAAGTTLTVTLNGKTYAASVLADGTWSAAIPAADVGALAAGTVTVTVAGQSAAGNPVTISHDVTVDLTAVAISIDTIAADDVINAAEKGADLVLSGSTSNVEENQTVTVTFGGKSYTATVDADGNWTATVPSADLAGLKDGDASVQVSVTNAHGNSASAGREYSVDATAPGVTIDTVAGDNVINGSEASAGVTVSGTTTAEAGQTVTVTLGGNSYTAQVQPGGTWSVSVPSADLSALADNGYTVQVSVSDTAGGIEGGMTKYEGEVMPIYDAAMRHKADGTPLVIVAGKEYGTGSSRDWAAKGTNLLGVRAVITESFERIHRSNLVGMGVLPLQFAEGVTRETLKLDGSETFTIQGVAGLRPRQDVEVILARKDGSTETFLTKCRIDTVNELEYFLNGGILQYVLRNLAA